MTYSHFRVLESIITCEQSSALENHTDFRLKRLQSTHLQTAYQKTKAAFPIEIIKAGVALQSSKTLIFF